MTDNKLLSVIETPCAVYKPYTEQNFVIDITGLWDTGAISSVISQRLISILNLFPISKCEMQYAQGKKFVNVYKINLLLPNGIEIKGLTVTEGIFENFDILIGMDIIRLGDFAITHKNGGTKFSFQIPSTNDIEFK
ncbi:MAG: hypothetical protein MJ198_09905 [Bacteroidales bacterium]|nr:hypothetical protein [Bacteroidales bacterium]